jgi:TetR/AcrR family transcriptional regulator, lmrAB and yxaGH operons repressor
VPPNPSPASEESILDTRERIVRAGMRLFRKQGYHGTGLADIVALAQAPKGSVYHHFPQGKQAIGVAVIEALGLSIVGLMAQSKARSTRGALGDLGAQLAAVMERTNHELCALFSGFVAERRSNPELGDAVARAYAMLAERFAERLRADGFTAKTALDVAQTVVMLLEGGAVLAQARQSNAPFLLAVKQAQRLCEPSKS